MLINSKKYFSLEKNPLFAWIHNYFSKKAPLKSTLIKIILIKFIPFY